MQQLLDNAIAHLSKDHKDFIIYTASIWTDPNGAISSINFDSKENSDKQIKTSNDFNKKYFDEYSKQGDLEQAKLFEQIITRNCNPADFELREFETIKNKSFPSQWEEQSDGECWDILENALKEHALVAREKLNSMKLHPEFELAVNGREDWYMFTWR